MPRREDILLSELMYDAFTAPARGSTHDNGNGGGPVANPPVITSSASPSVPENTVGTMFTVTATGGDGVLVYSIEGGADAAFFTIDSATGVVSSEEEFDFESPSDADADGVYELTVGVSDGVNPAVTQDVMLTVTDLESPSITSDDAFDFAEGDTGVVFTVTATGGTPPYTFHLSSPVGDQANFAIDSETGEVSVVAPFNFEAPADSNDDNVYELGINVEDAVGEEADQDVMVTVTDVAEAVAARYWRMTEFSMVSGTLAEMSEYQLWDAGGNTNSAATKTANQALSFGTIADATDNNLTTRGNWTNNLDTLVIKWDYGVGVTKTITGMKFGAYDNSSRFVKHVALEYSHDDSTWTRVFGGVALATYPGNNTLSALLTPPQLVTPGAPDTWNPQDVSGLTFSNGNLTVARPSGSTFMGARATMSRKAGKYYFEIVCDVIGATTAWGAGFVATTAGLNGGVNPNDSYTIWGTGQLFILGTGGATYSTVTAGMVLQFAYDAATGKLWIGQNDTWVGSGNPAAGTGQIATATAGNRYAPGALAHNVSATLQWTLRTRVSQFTMTKPSGFTAWSGE